MRAYTNLPRSATGAIPVLEAECVATSIKLGLNFFIIGNRLEFLHAWMHTDAWICNEVDFKAKYQAWRLPELKLLSLIGSTVNTSGQSGKRI